MRCPCGLGEDLETCCGPRLDGSSPAPTAEALMRSRYAAHAVADVEYLLRTHAPETRDELDPARARAWAEQSEWLGLQIRATEAGSVTDERGVVEFVARYDGGEGPTYHHERSTFRKIDGAWHYVRGTPGKAPGRNEPCLCGSGKKVKKCCG